MADLYSWEDEGYVGGSLIEESRGYRIAVWFSVILGIALFVGLIFGMKEVQVWLGIIEPKEIRTESFNLEQVEIASQASPEIEQEVIVPENLKASDLLAEVEELIPELDNMELDISPEVTQPEVALESLAPLDAGESLDDLLEPIAAPQVDHVLEQIGRTENLFEEAAVGQLLVEEGSVKAELVDPDALLKDAVSAGSGGLSEEGLPTGYASIDGLLAMATGELSRSRAALPSDLLFEYDRADLRETARLGLMKLAMLIDRNPEMFCILEGHSDLFGDEGYNIRLSRKRAQEVKNWLVRAMHLDGEQIVVRGFGNRLPKVREGTIEEQALNRRVDILMRKTIPESLPVPLAQPKQRDSVDSVEVTKPLKALPVEESEEDDVLLRALPVE